MRAEIEKERKVGAEKGGGAGVEIEEEVGMTGEAESEVEAEAGEGLEAAAGEEAEAWEGRSVWRPGRNYSGKLRTPRWGTMNFTSGTFGAAAGRQS